MRDTTGVLAAWLALGGQHIGQIVISRHGECWELRHEGDAGRGDLGQLSDPEDARLVANHDETGEYRPLKTKPNLRRGWRLTVANVRDVRKALDYFYPAMLGVWLAEGDGELVPVNFRETLGRQSGMYRVTQKLTDEQAQQVIAQTCCNASCIKTILWRLDAQQTITSLPADKFTPPTDSANMPLLCHEACNLLVAAARKAVKGEA